MKLSNAEVTTILAALRFSSRSRRDFEMMPHFTELKPLSEVEVDALCEHLNCGVLGEDAAPDLISAAHAAIKLLRGCGFTERTEALAALRAAVAKAEK